MERTSKKLRALLSLWNGKRGPRPMPARSDFSHADFRAWMGNLALIDLSISDGAVFRLCGTNLHDRFGGEQTGRRVAVLGDNVGSSLRCCIENVLIFHRPHVTTHARVIHGAPATFHELCLPLSDSGLHIGTLLFASYPVQNIRAAASVLEQDLDGPHPCLAAAAS